VLLTRLLRLAVQGLLRRRLRSSFTLGSVIVGTAGLLLFLGVASGLEQQLQAQLGAYEPATILHVDPPLSAPSSAPTSGPPPGIDAALLQKLRSLPHVRDVFAEVQVGGTIAVGGTTSPLELRPVPPSYVSTGADVHLLGGRLFTAPDAHELVVSAGFLEAMNGAPPPGGAAATSGATPGESASGVALTVPTLVGRQAEFTPQGPDGANGQPVPMRIVGVIDGRAPFAYVPYNVGLSLLAPNPDGSPPSYEAAIVEVDGVQQVAAVRQAIQADQLHIETSDTLAKSLTNALSLARLVAAIIALAGLMLAVVNITNMLLAAVTERAREIGVMKAVGARSWHIGTLFLLESLMLGLVGSIVGSGIALLLARLLLHLVPLQLPGGPPLTLAISSAAVLLTILAVTALSGLAGLLPALRAARLDPAAAIAGAH
jgi:ABC-type antimicrobial peptide transport system permease subunit